MARWSAVHRNIQNEAEMPTDMLASLLMEQARARRSTTREASRLRAVYGVMGATTLLTFATLTTCYHWLFAQQVFA